MATNSKENNTVLLLCIRLKSICFNSCYYNSLIDFHIWLQAVFEIAALVSKNDGYKTATSTRSLLKSSTLTCVMITTLPRPTSCAFCWASSSFCCCCCSTLSFLPSCCCREKRRWMAWVSMYVFHKMCQIANNKRQHLIFSDQLAPFTQLVFELCLRTHISMAQGFTRHAGRAKIRSGLMEIIACLTFSPSSCSLAMLLLSSSCFSCSTASSCVARRCCRASWWEGAADQRNVPRRAACRYTVYTAYIHLCTWLQRETKQLIQCMIETA